MKRIMLLITGNISLAFGIVGIFLPVLPTTPFLLLSATCYVRSSEKLYLWLIHHKFLGLYVRSYIQYRAISMRAKIISISMLWTVILSTVIFFVDLPWLRGLLIMIAVGVTVYLMRIKTLTRQMIDELEGENPQL